MKRERNPGEVEPRYRPDFRFLLIGLTLVILVNFIVMRTGTEELPYSEFLKKLSQGQIARVVIEDGSLRGEFKGESGQKKTHFIATAVNDESLTQKLVDQNVEFKGEKKNPVFGFFFTWIFPLILFYFFWTFILRRSGGLGAGSGLLTLSKSKAKVYVEKEIKTTFEDVAGIDEAREELQEIVLFLQDPKRYARLGGHAPKGVLLVGPPGTGKTLLARAVAGEAKVPFFSINGSEFVEMFVGLGAARVRDLFEQARDQVPCILFIDEIDALGRSRGMGIMSGASDEKEQTLNQLLAEMDGFDTSEGVIIFAATNRPEILDPALLRAGRFDRQIALGNPDQEGRMQVLKVHVKKIKLDPAVELKHIASMTSGFSGADLANLANEAALVATRRNADSVTEDDFVHAIERMIAGLEQKKKVMNPVEKRKTAYHELGHATVAFDLDVPDRVHKVTIIPHGIGALGYTLQRPEEDRYLLEDQELRNKISVLMGGRASEEFFFGTVTTGSANDLASATQIAKAMVLEFGMGKTLGLSNVERHRAPFLSSPFEFGVEDMSEATSREVDLEVKQILDDCYRVAFHSVESNKGFIEKSAAILLEKETLEEAELLEFWSHGRDNLSQPALDRPAPPMSSS